LYGNEMCLSFPQVKRVGNPSDSPLEKGVRGLFFRMIPDKSDADLREESLRPE